MSRGTRAYNEQGIYHIMFRGINKQDIFIEEFDYKVMFDYIKDVKKKLPFEIYSYCFMKNHVHLTIKENKMGDISLIMKKILVKYALYFNNKYKRTGHLFESRYKSKPITTDDYLFASIRYIHLNPVKAGISDSLEGYPWCSYNEYIKKIDGLTDKEFILKILSLSQFKSMHSDTTNEYDPFDEKSKILCELENDILNNYNISPHNIVNLTRKLKHEIFIELRKKYSLGDISKVTGISKSSIYAYK